jgi:hypothetical protein
MFPLLAALAGPIGGSWIITLLVVCIVVALCYWIITTLLPEPIQKFAIVILVVVCVLWLLSAFVGRLP